MNVAQDTNSSSRLKQVRTLLWALLAVIMLAIASSYLIVNHGPTTSGVQLSGEGSRFGGPFTLVDGAGKPFRSEALAGKPFAMYFGFTRCGDTCPTTLSRLVRLRREAAADESMQLLFITIDPTHDGPREVGQYALMFNAPIIGLTGTPTQINQVKKQYGIYAEAIANAPMGKEMEHTATVLLFAHDGKFAGTISQSESDVQAVEQLRKLVG